jgi:hypothetical protein
MPLVIADRVRETTTTSGTGTLTLAGPYSGFQAFSVIGNGNTTYYAIIDAQNGAWEVGIGAYTTSGNTLSRATVLASSNAGSLVNFGTGTKDVILTQPARRSVLVQEGGSGLITGVAAFTANGVPYADSTSTLATSANMTFNGTRLTVADLADSGLTSGRVTYASTGGALVDSANLTFDGTNLTLGGGTANGVAYLNGSKVLTTGSALTFDGTNLAVAGGSIWSTDSAGNARSKFEVFTNGQANNQITLGQGFASPTDNVGYLYNRANAAFVFGVNNAEQMRLTSTGLGIGTSSPNYVATLYKASLPVLQLANSTSGSTASDGLLMYLNGSNAVISNQETGSLAFETSGLTRATLDSSGNLGLGVTPSAWSGLTAFELSAAGSQNFAMYGGGVLRNAFYNGTNWIYKASAASTLYEQTAGAHRWYTAPSGTAGNAISFTQAMTLDASGNLLVGTTSPSFSAGSRGNITVGGSGSAVFALQTGGTPKGYVFHDGTEMTIANEANGFLRFYTNATERARIDSSGNLLVGTTSTNGARIQAATSSASGCIATVATASSGTRYHAVWYENTTERGSVTSNGGGVAYNSVSDYRMKENVTPLSGALAKVLRLKPCTFAWKGSGAPGEGFIAHELAEEFPLAVIGEKDAVKTDGSIKPQGVDTSMLVAALTAAIQELKAEFDAYKASHP